MAKEVVKQIKVQAMGGKATPAPPLGPVLGQAGINIGEFVNQFNEQTRDRMGEVVPVGGQPLHRGLALAEQSRLRDSPSARRLRSDVHRQLPVDRPTELVHAASLRLGRRGCRRLSHAVD